MKSVNIFLITIWFILAISKGIADPSVLHTFKGLGAVTTDRKYNPITGAMAEAYLKGVRYFGFYDAKNMEKENPLLKCIVKNRRNPQNNEQLPDNCPQDVVTALIQWLFPNATMDGNFAPNRRGPEFKDLVSRFTPATVGGILNAIAAAKQQYDQELESKIENVIKRNYREAEETEQLSLSSEILKIIQEKFTERFEKLGKNKPSHEQYKKFEDLLNYNNFSEKEKNHISQKDKPLDWQLSVLEEHNTEVKNQQEKLNQKINKEREKTEKQYKAQAILLSKIIVATLHQVANQQRSPSVENKNEILSQEISQNTPELLSPFAQELYHPDIVTMALLHFAWAISKDKQDVVTLLEAMPSVVDQQNLENYKKSTEVYTEKDYLELKNTFKDPEQFKGAAGLELAGILGFGFQYFERKFPEKIGYRNLPLFKEKYDLNQKNQERHQFLRNNTLQSEFPNCGENSLYMVFAYLLFNPITRTFDTNPMIQKANEDNINLLTEFVDFFKTHNTLASSQTYAAQVDWVRTTSSLKTDVDYGNYLKNDKGFDAYPSCEIKARSGVANMMAVIAAFLGQEYQRVQKNDFVDMTPLTTVLRLISTQDKQWTWKTGNEKDQVSKDENTTGNIVFYQNGQKIFTWTFKPGHFDTQVYLSPEANWLQQTGEKLLESKEILPAYFPLFVDKAFIPQNLKDLNLSPENLSFLFYSRELWNTDMRFRILGTIGNDSLDLFLDLGKRLIDSLKELALTDENAKKELITNTFKSNELGEYAINLLNLTKDTKFENGDSFLHLAARVGNIFFVKKYIEEGIEVNVQDKRGETPLHSAAHNGNLEIVKYLVENGADVNAKDSYEQTPLHSAAHNGNLEIVKYLVENGADVNAKDKGSKTSLHSAVHNGNLEITKYLVEKGADVNAKDGYEQTPLHSAAYNGNLEIAKYLVENGADVNAKDNGGKTPLHSGAYKGNLEIAKYLVEKGADVNAIDEKGDTPLNEAHDLEMAKYLVENGAGVNTKNKDGKTPLQFATYKDNLQMVKYLVENKADVNAKDKGGKTPLYWAAYKGNLDMVKYLIENGADMNIKWEPNSSPLHFAVSAGNLEMVKYLIENKADVNAKNKNGITPLYRAMYKDNLEIVKYLVENGADVNTMDEEGDTPLHKAAQNGLIDVVQYLVEDKQANISVKNEDGKTPLDLARENNQPMVVQYLSQKMKEQEN